MTKKHIALTTSETIQDWQTSIFNTNTCLSLDEITRFKLISCKVIDDIPVLDAILKNASDDLASLKTGALLSSYKQRELTKLYHLSNSPLSQLKNNKRASQLTRNIQTYIDTTLSNQKESLFCSIRESSGSEVGKKRPIQDIRTRLTEHPLLVCATITDGPWKAYTPLHVAAYSGKKDVAKLLLDKGAEVNLTITEGDWEGSTPLHLAATNGHTVVATCLIDTGAEVNSTVTDGYWKGSTPLHWAAKYGHTALATLLIDKGAEVNVKTEYGWSPLHLAADKGHTDVATLLIDKDTEVNTTPTDGPWKGYTPLHFAAYTGHTAVATCLINKGAKLDMPDKDGNTPLHLAAGAGKLDTIKAFIDHEKTDPERLNTMLNAKNNVGDTPLYCAGKEGHRDMVLLLSEAANTQALQTQVQSLQAQNHSQQVQIQSLQAQIKMWAGS